MPCIHLLYPRLGSIYSMCAFFSASYRHSPPQLCMHKSNILISLGLLCSFISFIARANIYVRYVSQLSNFLQCCSMFDLKGFALNLFCLHINSMAAAKLKDTSLCVFFLFQNAMNFPHFVHVFFYFILTLTQCRPIKHMLFRVFLYFCERKKKLCGNTHARSIFKCNLSGEPSAATCQETRCFPFRANVCALVELLFSASAHIIRQNKRYMRVCPV